MDATSPARNLCPSSTLTREDREAVASPRCAAPSIEARRTAGAARRSVNTAAEAGTLTPAAITTAARLITAASNEGGSDATTAGADGTTGRTEARPGEALDLAVGAAAGENAGHAPSSRALEVLAVIATAARRKVSQVSTARKDSEQILRLFYGPGEDPVSGFSQSRNATR